MFSNMKAKLLIRQRIELSDVAFAEIAIWRVPSPVRGSAHGYKYRMALVVEGVCRVRYDNEAGKGDHKHVGDRQMVFPFEGLETLQEAFWRDVEQWLNRK